MVTLGMDAPTTQHAKEMQNNHKTTVNLYFIVLLEKDNMGKI